MKHLIPAALVFLLAAVSVLAVAGYSTAASIPGAGSAPVLAPAACTERTTNGGFESGTSAWQVNTNGPGPLVGSALPHTGTASAILGGRNNGQDELEQEIILPAGQIPTFRFWWYMVTQETTHPFDTLDVSVRLSGGQEVLLTTITDGNTAGAWQQGVFDLSAYAGQTVRIKFTARTSDSRPTTFYLDDVSVQSCAADTATPTATSTQTATPTGTSTATLTATATAPASSQARHTINFPVNGFQYSPAEISISVGDEVEWLGPFTFHPLVSDDNLWPTVNTGDSFRFIFTQPGIYRFHCQIHGGPGGVGMSGVVLVGLSEHIYLPVLFR